MAADESWRDKSVAQRNLHFLNSGLMADCTIVLGTTEKKKFQCHKYVLSQGSPVFYAMFNGDLKEKGDVTVEDIEPENFWKMLEFIYSDNTELENAETALSVYFAADKYMINTLSLKCIDFIKKNLEADIVIRTLEFARLINHSELEAQSLQYLSSNTSAVLKSASFHYAERATLLTILSQDACDATEAEIFSACIRWAKVQDGIEDKLRDVLGPEVLSLIRFLTMTAEEFATVVIPSTLLQLQEERDILCCIITGNGNLPRGFNTNMNSRAVLAGPKEIVSIRAKLTFTRNNERHLEVSGVLGQTLNNSPFIFSVNVECVIYGVKLCGHANNSKIDDRFEVNLLQGSELLASAEYEGSLSNGVCCEVSFNKRCLLKANDSYTLQMRYSNLHNMYYAFTSMSQIVYSTPTGVRMNVNYSCTTIAKIYIAKKIK